MSLYLSFCAFCVRPLIAVVHLSFTFIAPVLPVRQFAFTCPSCRQPLVVTLAITFGFSEALSLPLVIVICQVDTLQTGWSQTPSQCL
ncbi:hypothetical protein EV424DRAFT_1415535 [Suillus variegatus]|nr:hypothetical protein EV424DRAFT_1415535 [Suillus variegatus]